MKKMQRLLIVVLWVVCASGMLQAATVTARLDSASILMGEQTLLRFQVSFTQGKSLKLPAMLGNFLPPGIELLSVMQPDTAVVGNGIIQVNQNFLVTSFDSALYYIDPIKVTIDSDTFYSNSLALKVIEIPIDTTELQIVDIQEVEDAPFVWADWHWIVTSILAVLAAVLWGIYYLQYRKRHPQDKSIPHKPISLAPADVTALSALEELKQEKLWQRERSKEYYTRLTDILRLYLEQQFGIDAVEMTSQEIWSEVKYNQDLRPLFDEFVRLLETSDLVKFAKYQSLPDENERSWMLVKHIVEASSISFKERLKEMAKEAEEKSSN